MKNFDAYTAPISEVLDKLSTSVETGLSQQVAGELRKAEGPNSSTDKFGLFPWLMVLVYTVPALALAAIIYRGGDLVSAIIIATGALVMAAGLYALVHRVVSVEGRRANLRRIMERSLVDVVREGSVRTMPGRHLVPGDILLYDRAPNVILPADCRVLPGHDVRIRRSWQYGWQDGTRLVQDADVLLAGTDLSLLSGTFIVIAIGDKRLVTDMEKAHPAGPLVQSVWRAGWWYLLAVLLVLGASWSQGLLLRAAYALAVGIPFLLPFFLLKKGRSLRMQNTGDAPDHLLYPVEQLLYPKPKEATILLREHTLPFTELKSRAEDIKATAAQFLELLDLCVRDDATTRHGSLLQKIVKDSKRHGLSISSMEDWTLDADMSSITFHQDTGTYCYMGSFVQRDDEQENSLHLVCNDAATILQHCTYIWDAKEHTMRRRFFNGEKQQLANTLTDEHKAGNISYGLAIRENAHADAPWIYIGALVIPRGLHTETLQELHSYASNGHAVVFYTETALSPEFARTVLKVPEKHLFDSPEDLTFTGLRRNDFFLASKVDAVGLRKLHERLSGAVLVDTREDRFVSSLYFWPLYMRFDAQNTPSFFRWLTAHTRQARDGMTKAAQYLGLLLVTSVAALVLLLNQPGTAADFVFLLGASAASILALIALLAHFADKKIHHKKIHQLAFLDIQQALTGVQVMLGGFIAGGSYLLLAGTQNSMTHEFILVTLLGMAAATLSRLAADTASMLFAGLFSAFYLIMAIWGYIFLLAGHSALTPDIFWLFGPALVLGGITWIMASYQGVPERRA